MTADTLSGATKAPLDSSVVKADSATRVTFGAFLDAYIAYDRGRPRSLDRGFTTQAARHSEFNVNLAHVEAVLSAPRVHGRLALQAGTSVQVNYAGEPRLGNTSGGDLSRVLQEAYAGYQLRPGLWIDAGVFFSNVGMEGWLSRDNSTYTRSLVADYSPYYSSGARMVWQATSNLAVRVDVVNGWQNISENNEGKSVGVRLDRTVGKHTTVSWYALAGNEAGGHAERDVPARTRLFNGVGIRSRALKRLDITSQIDLGRESTPDSAGVSRAARTWSGGMVAARLMLTPRTALAGRVERYADRHQVVAVTGTALPLRASGGSLGLDTQVSPSLAWRTEARFLTNRDAVFVDRAAPSGLAKRNTVLVTSLALSY
ncbi:hypothetical protein MASR1M101_16940 [Gemmatimonas sp.]